MKPCLSSVDRAYAELNPILMPSHWNDEQALAVWEFLQDLTNAVWDRYELALVKQLKEEMEQPLDDQPDLFDPDDDIPD